MILSYCVRWSVVSLVGWLVFYAAFNNISVIWRRLLTFFISFLGFTSTRPGLWNVLPKDIPTKKKRTYCVVYGVYFKAEIIVPDWTTWLFLYRMKFWFNEWGDKFLKSMLEMEKVLLFNKFFYNFSSSKTLSILSIPLLVQQQIYPFIICTVWFCRLLMPFITRVWVKGEDMAFFRRHLSKSICSIPLCAAGYPLK